MIKRGLFIAFLIITLFPLAIAQSAPACVESIISDISPSSIEIDEDFTVGIIIEGCGGDIPENVVFEITKKSDDIIVKEPLITNIGTLNYANSKRFMNYNMRTTTDAKPGVYNFETKLTYETNGVLTEKDGNFSITVRSDEAEINIAQVKPSKTFPEAGEEFTLTIQIENFGDADANSVKVEINPPFEGVKTSFIGELESGDDGIATFNLIPEREGTYNFQATITYRDDFGEKQLNEELQVIVVQKMQSVIIPIIVILIIAIIIWYFYTKRRKEKQEQVEEFLEEKVEDKKKKKSNKNAK